MRILFATHYQVPHLGGIEVIVDHVAGGLAARGHEVAVVSSAAGLGGGAPALERPYRQIGVPAFNGLETRLGVPYPLLAPALLRVLRREVAAADVVHAHGWLYQPALAALALARRPGQVRVLTEHVAHVPYPQRVLDLAETAAEATLGTYGVRRAQAVVVYNDTVAREVARRAPGGELVTISNGVDTDRFRPAGPGERERLRAQLGWDERPRVLFTGRPVAKKGFDVAVATAQRAGLALAVAGADRLPPGTPAGVELLGRLTPERMAAAYRAADAILMPARGEGLPLSAQEAIASALPVVMTDDPGYRRFVEGAGAALRLLPADAGAMAAGLRDVLRLRAERPDALDALVAFAQREFSWSRCVDEHLALYRRLGAPLPWVPSSVEQVRVR